MDKKEVFACAICGALHNNVLDRAKCEIACAEKQEEEAKKAAARKKAAEYEARKREVDMAFDHAYELREKFLKDYGSYTFSKPVSNNFRNAIDTFGWLL